MNKESYKIIELPKHFDPRGSLTVAEETRNVPFHITNVEWKYGMTEATSLVSLQHENAKKLIVPLSGSFRIKLCDGPHATNLFLNLPNKALFIANGIKYSISDCANGTVILILSGK